MHPAAHQYVAQIVSAFGQPASVIEVGSRDINGTIRDLFPSSPSYVGLDLYPGPGVDWVGDAREYQPPEPVAAIVCCEVFEHMAEWPGLVRRFGEWLQPGGWVVVTTAGPNRREHSGVDGGRQLHQGEHYGNVTGERLGRVLTSAGFRPVTSSEVRGHRDTHALAVWPAES